MHRLDMEHRLVKVPARLRSTVDDAVASGLFMDASDLAIHMMRELLLAEPSTARAAYVSFGPVPAMEDTFAVTLRIPRGMVREARERGSDWPGWPPRGSRSTGRDTRGSVRIKTAGDLRGSAAT